MMRLHIVCVQTGCIGIVFKLLKIEPVTNVILKLF
jgi:hypothetical protein